MTFKGPRFSASVPLVDLYFFVWAPLKVQVWDWSRPPGGPDAFE